MIAPEHLTPGAPGLNAGNIGEVANGYGPSIGPNATAAAIVGHPAFQQALHGVVANHLAGGGGVGPPGGPLGINNNPGGPSGGASPGFRHRDTYNYQWAEKQRGASPDEQWALENARKTGNLGALPQWLRDLMQQNAASVAAANRGLAY